MGHLGGSRPSLPLAEWEVGAATHPTPAKNTGPVGMGEKKTPSPPHPSMSSQDTGYSMAFQAFPCGHLLLYLVNTRHLIHQRCAWTLPGSPGDSPHQYEDLCGKTTYPVLDCNPHLDSPIRSSQTPSGRLPPPLHRQEAESRHCSASSPPCPCHL